MSKGYGYAFLSGVLLGVAGGMLLAPKKGEELRKDLKIKGDEVYEKIASYDYSAHKEAFVNKVDDFKGMVQDLDKEKVKDISLESLENLKGKAEELVSTAKKEVKKTVNKEKAVQPVVNTVDTLDEDEDLFDDL